MIVCTWCEVSHLFFTSCLVFLQVLICQVTCYIAEDQLFQWTEKVLREFTLITVRSSGVYSDPRSRGNERYSYRGPHSFSSRAALHTLNCLCLRHRSLTVCSSGSFRWRCCPTAPCLNTRLQTIWVVAPPPSCALCKAGLLQVHQLVGHWNSLTLWRGFLPQVLQIAWSLLPKFRAAVSSGVY